MDIRHMLLILPGFSLSFNAQISWAQEQDLEVIFVTSERVSASKYDTPFVVDQLSADDIRNNLMRSLPDALNAFNGVMVQKTSYGQGSPYIRGFTGFRTLFLYDGIRLNNSTFREGPNQYWNTVDAFTIEKMEIVKGPSSSLYGADAIGGTVQAFSTELNTGPAVDNKELNYFYRAASAEHSQLIHTSFKAEGKDLAYQLGASYKDFGDLTRGNNIIQKNTGYPEYNMDAKLALNLNQQWSLVSAAYLTQQDDVPRTHSTIYSTSFAGTTIGNELRRDLTQKRLMAYVKLVGQEVNEYISNAQITLSYQQQKEDRERLRSRSRFDTQGVRTNTLGLQLQLSSELNDSQYVYGIDAYFDQVDSYSSSNSIQGPVADDASYTWLGAYIQARTELDKKWDLLAGGRINYMQASADKISDPTSGEILTLDNNWNNVVGNIAINYLLNNENNLYAGIAQGFRAPNLSDLTRFDTARSNEFEIPATELDSEHYTNYSIGYKHHSKDLIMDWSIFYTSVNDQIERIPTGNQNAEGEFEISKENIGDGYFSGAELAIDYQFSATWSLSTQLAYITGKSDTYSSSEKIESREYASRLMPAMAKIALNYAPQHLPWWGSLSISAAEKADRLSPRDELDTDRIPPGGTPGYEIVTIHSGYTFSDKLALSCTIENLFDKDYRIHGSGQNEAGFNFILGLSGKL
jgi:hemoglobin/transferrin/lactoferrin receptor protein